MDGRDPSAWTISCCLPGRTAAFQLSPKPRPSEWDASNCYAKHLLLSPLENHPCSCLQYKPLPQHSPVHLQGPVQQYHGSLADVQHRRVSGLCSGECQDQYPALMSFPGNPPNGRCLREAPSSCGESAWEQGHGPVSHCSLSWKNQEMARGVDRTKGVPWSCLLPLCDDLEGLPLLPIPLCGPIGEARSSIRGDNCQSQVPAPRALELQLSWQLVVTCCSEA